MNVCTIAESSKVMMMYSVNMLISPFVNHFGGHGVQQAAQTVLSGLGFVSCVCVVAVRSACLQVVQHADVVKVGIGVHVNHSISFIYSTAVLYLL